jgi:hypothetical protein
MLVFCGHYICSIIRPNGIFNGHLVHFELILYILSRFGMLNIEKSDNPIRRWGSGTGSFRAWVQVWLNWACVRAFTNCTKGNPGPGPKFMLGHLSK